VQQEKCITGGPSTADYTLAFTSFNATTDPNSFGSQGYTLVFVTDDSEAEQAAMSEVCSDSLIKLCLFHVQQAVWCWLWETKHGVEKSSCKLLMGNFKQLVRWTVSYGTSTHNGRSTCKVTGIGDWCGAWPWDSATSAELLWRRWRSTARQGRSYIIMRPITGDIETGGSRKLYG